MSSAKTVPKTIRIKNETAEYFRDKPLNRYVDGLCAYMISGEIGGTDDGISVHTGKQMNEGSVHTNKQWISEKVMRDIEQMCSLYGTSVDDFMEKICKAMNDGIVAYEDGDIVVYNPEEIDLSRFKEACNAKGVECQKMIDRATQNVWKS